ncbi:MAG: acetylglutamate kinase [Armatimonadetes bacterium]|nr:acetylglutamate kinase [Armatimonadota bacterium]
MNTQSFLGLRKAVPYLQLYRGQTFVIKLGGEVLRRHDDLVAVLEQIGVLHQLGIKTVIVHGGGPQANELAARMGVKFEFVEGRRVTNEEMIQVLTYTLNGEAQATMLSACRELGHQAVGLSGLDAGLIIAEKRKPKNGLDYGQVGDVVTVNPGVIQHLLADGYLPIVSPLSADAKGGLLNINADSAACAIAVALGATKLILVTSAPGILKDLNDPLSIISQLDLKQLKALEQEGTFDGGMLPKAASIESALRGGVGRVHVVGFTNPDSLLLEVFTNEGCGTLIVREEKELLPSEHA